MSKGKIIILSGPSGSGKTTIYKQVLQQKRFQGRLAKTVSVTTRPPRAGEKQGVDYSFISPKMFRYKIRAGHLFEYQKVFNHYYGTPKKNVRDILRSGKNVLLCIDVKGALVVSRNYPQAVKIFIKTATLQELTRRLKKRKTEAQAIIDLRLKTAKQELAKAREYDYVVINDKLQEAVQEVADIISREIGPK